MKYKSLDVQIEDRILTLTLHRPQNMNAFTIEMGRELIDVFQRASDDDEVGVVLVTGSGKAFCAGMDLSGDGNAFGLDESQRPTLEDLENRYEAPEIINGVRDVGGQVTLAIYDCNKPVVAAINGAAVGIGATMTLAMDVRFASERARMGFVFGKIGITMEACSSWFLPRIVGLGRALELVYSGKILKAVEMAEIGLVNHVCKSEELLTEARAFAAELARRSPVSTALMRHMLYRASTASHPREAHKIDSLSIFYTSIGDGKEGVRSFLEKRDPEFTKRVSKDMPPFFPWWDDTKS